MPSTTHTPHALGVAIVTETYPPEVNGVALTVQKLVQGLRRRGHTVSLVRPHQATEPSAQRAGEPDPLAPNDELLTRGLPIPQYPQLRVGLPAKVRLMKHWHTQRPDIVHVATEGPLGWSAVSAAKALGIPVSSDFRTHFDTYSQHYGLGALMPAVRAYLRHFHNRAHSTMVPNPGLRDALSAQGFKRLLVVGRGVDSAQFSPAHRDLALRAQWGVQPQQRVVLSVGRLAAEKNFALLAKAWAAMLEADPTLALVIVGDGPMREAVRAQFPQAVMAGLRRGAELAQHYASADLFVFPSTSETYGNVLPEAMASGLSVVAYDYAAASEWVAGDSRDGIRVALNDEAAFVQACVNSCLQDAQAHQQRRQAARQTALARDWASIVAQIEAHWHSLLPRETLAHSPFAAFHSP